MSVATEQALASLGSTSKTMLVDEVSRKKWLFLAIAALMVLLYVPNFVKLWNDWGIDENYSHGYIVPLVFAWILYGRREQLESTEVAPRWWGLGIVLLGLAQLVVGRLGAENFTAHSSLLVVLSGVTIFLFGTGVFRLVAFPIAWLLLMIPIPAIIFYSLTFPLQMFASSMASKGLDLIGISNLREGNVIVLSNYSMGVVEACSGIRSLISLLAVSVLLGYFREMKSWARLLLMVSAVPIALVVNSLRIAGTGIAGNYLGAKYAEGFFHTFSGWLLFLLAMLALFGVSGLLSRKSDAKA